MSPETVVSSVGAVAAMVTALLAARQKRRVDQVHNQVANDHKTNLREDIDAVLLRLGHVMDVQELHTNQLDGMQDQINGMQDQINTERNERINLDRRVEAARRHNGR